MKRLDTWKARLSDYVLGAGNRPLVFGSFDCMLFAAGGVEAVTGVDLAADFRGRYTTVKGGLRVLKRAGFADQMTLMDARLGPRLGWVAGAPGDVAAVPGADGLPAAGIVQGALIYTLGATGGLGMTALDTAIAVWKVGDV